MKRHGGILAEGQPPTSRRPLRRLATTTLALALAGSLVPIACAGSAAATDADSVVRGVVTSADPSQNLAQLRVIGYSLTDENLYFSDQVAADGTWATEAEPGEYVVGVYTPSTEGAFVYWSPTGMTFDEGSAGKVPVTQRVTVDDIHLTFTESGVSGTVVSRLDAAPDTDHYGEVYAYPAGVTQNEVDDPDLYFPSQIVDLSDGNLNYDSIAMALQPGRYKFALVDDDQTRTWFGGSNLAGASVVTVAQDRKTAQPNFKIGTTAAVPAMGKPRVLGSAGLGSTLTLDLNSAGWPSGTTFEHHWSPDDSTEDQYVVQQSDFRTAVPLIKNYVTATIPGWEPIYTATPWAAAPSGTVTKSVDNRITAAPSISGPAQVGQVLSTTGGAWSGAATRSYQWLRNGGAIPGATGTSYRLTPEDVGTAVSVLVTAAESPYVNRSQPTGAVAFGTLSTGNPSIVGKRKVKKTVSVAGLESSPAAVVSIQWLRKGKPIPGANGTSYKIAKADKGKKKGLSVQVTWSTPGYVPITKVSPVVKVK